ncbi:MAG: hypothetical protein NVV82_11130 [Sporocytophaga sp.]|nr:hypothetical protein [Sporocytophaga sp.]
MIHFVTIVFAVYFIYTLNFAIQFNRTNTLFTDNQKLLHNIFIWIIPFFWIIIIKTIEKPTPGSDKFKKGKRDSGFNDSNNETYGHDYQSDGGHGYDAND